MELKEIIAQIRRELDARDARREEVFAVAREIRRLSTRAMREIHQDNHSTALALIREAAGFISGLEEDDFRFSLLQEAVQEYVEAVLTFHLLRGEKIPSHRELRVPPEWYLLGLADVVGELRRHVLELLRRDELERIDHLLDLMDEITNELNSLVYPNAIVAIKRKQDVARMIMERTLGEVTLAKKESELRRVLEELHSSLK
ncbi:haloacid dehalogenase [Candidatus Pyrohabitans sp.]